MKITEADLALLQKKNISLEKFKNQLQQFKTGLPKTILERAATLNDGILSISKPKSYQELFLKKAAQLRILKFVPASGAATRMFKFLFEFLAEYDKSPTQLSNHLQNKDVRYFLDNIKLFPFYDLLLTQAKQQIEYWERLPKKEQELGLIKALIEPNSLNFGELPKGLIPFHKYNKSTVTAFEEHLIEFSKLLTKSSIIRLHFTILEQHHDLFKQELNQIRLKLKGGSKPDFEVRFSYQNPSTDTVAVDLNNEPLRDANGTLTFRPSGHGALLSNLNALDADIVFIKNIDNIPIRDKQTITTQYQALLAGVLLDVQQKSFEFAKRLDTEAPTKALVKSIYTFLQKEVNECLDDTFFQLSIENQVLQLKSLLNRPIRVCGMVKNQGALGGGPFWVRLPNNQISLQIVESAQIDKSDSNQLSIFKKATHFNPVDMVCGLKNYKGETYKLGNFVDANTGFITQKTKGGTVLKALELPGLWNGSMAFWNTIFVELPTETFSPVKTVNNLLNPAHQNELHQ